MEVVNVDETLVGRRRWSNDVKYKSSISNSSNMHDMSAISPVKSPCDKNGCVWQLAYVSELSKLARSPLAFLLFNRLLLLLFWDCCCNCSWWWWWWCCWCEWFEWDWLPFELQANVLLEFEIVFDANSVVISIAVDDEYCLNCNGLFPFDKHFIRRGLPKQTVGLCRSDVGNDIKPSASVYSFKSYIPIELCAIRINDEEKVNRKTETH